MRPSRQTDHTAPWSALGLSPEARLVLATAGGPEADGLLRDLSARVRDWGRVGAIAQVQGAQPVLSRRLRALDVRLPDEARRELGVVERFGELRAAYLRRRLEAALARLADAGLRVMLLKGAALAYATHGSFAARPMADVDLLVHPADATRALALLAADGWERLFDPAYDALYVDMHHLPPLVDARMPAMAMRLELHTALFPPAIDAFALRTADLWARAEPVQGLPEGVVVPGPEHRLLHCCLHFAWSHKLSSGTWRALRDVTAIWHEGRVDWDAFLAEARRTGGGTCVYWTLRLARDFAATPIPASLLARAGAPWPEPVNRLLARHHAIVGAADGTACPSLKLGRLLWSAAIRPSANGLGARRPWHGEDKPWEDALRSVRGAPAAAVEAPAPATLADWLGYLRAALA